MAAVPGGWKTGNYWQNLRALQSARREGFEEAAVAGVDGSVLGAATGNLFVVKDRRLLTPPVASGARPGVVRAWVIEQAGAQEFPLTFEDLLSAEEIFLTNSRLGIATVRSVESVPLATTAFAQALASDYREQVLLR
jgi:branched-chain amino acid aminotransferase